ncbi:MAG TPA: hypothetical protein VMF64_11015 [Steroidobacteraceae bacterium]|nr:hypothetical protein [Steroidobacteraceae bacterium]
MRIYEDRYTRERVRFQVALRFIWLEARTQTIRHWTGLTDDRIRKLYRSYLAHCGRPLARHRGKSPQRVALFLRSARLRRESSLLASLFRLLGALPTQSLPATPSTPGAPRAPGAQGPSDAQPGVAGAVAARPSLLRAQLLCEAYELYRTLLGNPALGFEHAVFLLQALLQAEEITAAPCPDCQALVVMDRWALYPARCAPCAAGNVQPPGLRAEAPADLPVPPQLCKTARNGDLHARHARHGP